MRNKICSILFILVFFLILLYPIFGIVVDDIVTLSGVSSSVQLKEFNPENVMDGSFQTSLNAWIENNFPGRGLLINLRSQLRYSLLNESPNSNVLVGKDKYLFETPYIDHELSISTVDEAEIDDTIIKLEQLQELMEQEGKELYLFITPSKAYFCKDKIPDYYFALSGDRENDYILFTRKLKESSVRYFDSHAFIENYNGPELNAPRFYSTGIHWSSSWGYSAAMSFADYISQSGKWELSTLKLIEEKADKPNWPDADLYQSLNLIAEPVGTQYYSATLSITEEKDRPNVFLRGGSFMGQSLNGLIQAGVFNKNIHLENNYYFTEGYSSSGTLPSYTAYAEMDILREYISQTDILILEVNEDNVGGLAFGFVDFLLENPDYLKKQEG